MRLLATWISDRRVAWAIVLLTLVATVVCGVAAVQVEQDDDLLAFLPEGNADIEIFEDVNKRFGGLDVALVGIETEDVFDASFLAALTEATDEIKDTADFARRVVSLMSDGIDMTGFMPETSTTVSAPGPGTEVAEAADVEVITPDGEVVTPPEDEGVISWYDAGKRL